MVRSTFKLLLLLAACVAAAGPLHTRGQSKDDGLAALVQLIGQVEDDQVRLDLLKGISAALEGRRRVPMPDDWPTVYAKLSVSRNQQVRQRAIQLALTFGDQQAVAKLRSTLMDAAQPAAARRQALAWLVSGRVAGLESDLFRLLQETSLRRDAIRALASYDDSRTPAVLLELYGRLGADQRAAVIQTLAARPQYAAALLGAVEQKRIAVKDISAFAARQIDSLGDAEIRRRLQAVWGDVQQTSAGQAESIRRYKRTLTDEYVARGDLSAGRQLFDKHCRSCHKLYGEGGAIGPDITGSNRDNLDYILENIVAPSAVVPLAYKMNVVATIEGRVLNGIVVADTPQTVTLQTVDERIVLDRDDIQYVKPSPVSMMPDGLLDKLSNDEVRDLVAYLRVK